MTKNLPVEKNKKYVVKIESVSSDGNGVAKILGYTLFIPDAVAGDEAEVLVLKTKSAYGYAKIVDIITPSPYRQDTFCKVSNLCGGCSFCHIDYSHQLEIKKGFVFDAIKRIAKIFDFEISDTVGMDEPFFYRNKMVFPCARDEKGNITFGFFKERSHDIVPLDKCFLGDEINFDILNVVKAYMKKFDIAPYDESTHSGVVRRVFIRKSYYKSEIMVVVCASTKTLPNKEFLIDSLKKLSPDIVSIILNVNNDKNNLVLGKKNITLFGKNTISDTLLGDVYEISPHSFFQVNPVQTEKLYSLAIDYADINKDDTVFDIYCGIGTISLAASKFAKKVIGVEIVDIAIENAKENAIKNNHSNTEFYASDAKDIVPKLIKDGIRPDVVILDPPRKGSDEETLSAIAFAKPKRIVYVSCNPSTLARDIAFLCEKGYKLQKVTPVDMFPHTHHVECCVLLCREEKGEKA